MRLFTLYDVEEYWGLFCQTQGHCHLSLSGLVLASLFYFIFSILPLFQIDVTASSLLNVLEGAKAPNLNLFMRETPDNLIFKDILEHNWRVCCWNVQVMVCNFILVFCWLTLFFFWYELLFIFFSLYWVCYTIASVLWGFLAARNVEPSFPAQGLNPHPLQWEV